MQRVLIVDDEVNIRWVLKEALETAGYEVLTADSGAEALALLPQKSIDLVVLDLKMKGMDGLATLARLRERWPEVIVIILTAYGTVGSAVEAMHLGAADVLRKPFDLEEVRFKIQRSLERAGLHAEVRRLRHAAAPAAMLQLAGNHPRWLQCCEQVRSAAQIAIDLLLYGPAGSGKAQLARYAHHHSSRASAPLVEVDGAVLAELPWQLAPLNPDAAQSVWTQAGQGSVLLRNVQHLSVDYWTQIKAIQPHIQARLLLTSDTLLSCAGACLPIAVPSLAEHASDIVLIAAALYPELVLTPTALTLLEGADWPGNITQLKHILERAQTLAQGQPIEDQHLPQALLQSTGNAAPWQLPGQGISLEELEKSLIQQALLQAHGNKSRAAELLGLTRHTLLYRLEKHGLE